MKKLILMGMVAAAGAAMALPHYGDENQAYDKMPGTYETPHVKWATPLAGGKLKALVILPYNMTREAVELKQRIDLDMTVIQTAGKQKRAQGYREGPTATPLVDAEAEMVVDRIMKERLVEAKEKYDVIVLAKVGWEVFKPDEKAAIVRRVKDGAGLVWYEPKGEGDDYRQLVGEVDEQVREEVFRGYPADVFPIAFFKTTEEMKLSYSGVNRWRAEKAPCRVLASRLGKGRVVAFDFCEENGQGVPTVFGTVFDCGDANNAAKVNSYDYTVYGYNFALAARAILVATGRDAKALSVELPKQFPRSSAQELKVKVKGEGEQRTARVLFEVRPRRAPHGARPLFAAEQKVENFHSTPTPNTYTSAFKMPALPAGTYLAAVRLRDETGAAIDFATTAFEVTADVSLKVATKSDRYEAGSTIEGAVTPSRPLKAGERIVVRATDTWNRRVAEIEAVRSTSTTSDYNFSIPVDQPLCRLWDLQAAVADAKGDVATAETWVGIPDWTFDDYMTMLIFCPQPHSGDWKGDYHADLMRRKAGVNAVYTAILHGNPTRMECNERHHLQSVCYSGHYGEAGNANDSHASFQKANTNVDTYAAVETLRAYAQRGCKPQSAKEFPYHQHCLDVNEFNSKIPVYRYVGKFGTPHYCLTMENYLGGEFSGTENTGFGPRATKAFQAWCRAEYGNDIAKLNAEWNTSFRSFDEVSGIMMVEAVLKDQQCRWLDFRYFMRSEVWGGLFLAFDKYIHTIDPHYGYVGMGGHAQHDYTKYRGPHMTSGKLYVSQKDNWEWTDAFECEMRQSFADDKGWWLGSQSNIRWTSDLNNPISRKRIPWAMLFMGLQGFDWENGLAGESLGGMTWEYADYSDILPFTAEIAEEVFRLERGIGKLTLASKPQRAPVAIDWSPRNHYLSRLLPEQPRGFSGSWVYNVSLIDGAPNDALGMMNSLRMRPKVVAPEDVAGLAKRGYKALWLPYNKGMSDAEAEAILAFVKGGGLVIADNEPGTYTQHGRKREKRLLKELFPDFARVTVTPYGKGHAAYLAGKLNCYPDRMLTGNFAGADIVAGLLEKYAGLRPAVGLTDKDGAPVRNVRLTEFDRAGTRLVGLLRKHVGTMPNDEITYTFDFGGEYDVYDVTKGCAYLGRHAKIDLAVDHYAKMLALVPAKILSATLTAKDAASGGKVDLSIAIATSQSNNRTIEQSNNSRLLADAWHLEVFGPDGQELECYRRNYVVDGDSAALTLPVALNAAKGTYKAVMTSAVSGVKAETAFAIR